jgi:hypothetical protein
MRKKRISFISLFTDVFLALFLLFPLSSFASPSSGGSYTVRFDTHGGTPIDPVVSENGLAPVPANPTRDGYIFAGWYTTEYPKELPLVGGKQRPRRPQVVSLTLL